MTPEEVLEMVYDLGRMDEFHNDDTWDENKANAIAAIERMRLEDRIDELKNVGGVNDSYESIGHMKSQSVKSRIAELQSKLEEK